MKIGPRYYVNREDFIRALNEVRSELMDDVKAQVIENRNLAHVNCLEESKQAFNQVINIIENAKRDKIR